MYKKVKRLIQKVISDNRQAKTLVEELCTYTNGINYLAWLKQNKYTGKKLIKLYQECDLNIKDLINKIEVQISREIEKNKIYKSIKSNLFKK